MQINRPQVVAAVQAAFDRYEQALLGNDLAVLDELFWHSPHTLRYGPAENLHGIAEIRRFRQQRPAHDLARQLQHTVITTFGEYSATTNTEFVRNGRRGRQSQTWQRLEEGWRIVAAHVSYLPEPGT